MTRELDQEQELLEIARREQLVKALEYGIVGALENQGIQLLGFSMKYDAFNCLLTIRADVGGERQVCFVGSDSLMNCFIKAQAEGLNGRLLWRRDKYQGR